MAASEARVAVVTVAISDGPADDATLYSRSWKVEAEAADMIAAKLTEIYGDPLDEGVGTVGQAVALAEVHYGPEATDGWLEGGGPDRTAEEAPDG